MKSFKISLNSNNLDDQLLKIREELEELAKSKKQYSQALQNHPEKDRVVDMLRDTGINSNWGMWFIRNYKKDPSILTIENMNKLKHLNEQTDLKEVKDFRFEGDLKDVNWDAGIEELEEVIFTGRQKNMYNAVLTPVRPEHTKIVDLGDGWGWWDLGDEMNDEEGRKMGHCGNSAEPMTGDRVLSLRKETETPEGPMVSSHLTFIENNGFIGEAKGKNNDKPDSKYHYAILKLLEDDRIQGIIGGGHQGDNNFQLKDFKNNPKLAHKYDELINSKPALSADNFDDIPQNLKESTKQAIFNSESPRVPREIARFSNSEELLEPFIKNADFEKRLDLLRNNARLSGSTIEKIYNTVTSEYSQAEKEKRWEDLEKLNTEKLFYEIASHKNTESDTLYNIYKNTQVDQSYEPDFDSSWEDVPGTLKQKIFEHQNLSSDHASELYQDAIDNYKSIQRTESREGIAFTGEALESILKNPNLPKESYEHLLDEMEQDNADDSIIFFTDKEKHKFLRNVGLSARDVDSDILNSILKRSNTLFREGERGQTFREDFFNLSSDFFDPKDTIENIENGNITEIMLHRFINSSLTVPNDIYAHIIYNEQNPRLLNTISSSSKTPSHVLDSIKDFIENNDSINGKDKDHIINGMLQNDKVSPEQINSLFDHISNMGDSMGKALASNPNTPHDLQDLLSEQEIPQLDNQLASNKNASPQALSNIASRIHENFMSQEEYKNFIDNWDDDAPVDLSNELARKNGIDTLKKVLKNHNTPPDALKESYEYIRWKKSDDMVPGMDVYSNELREILVRNPNTSADTLDKVYSDLNVLHGSSLKQSGDNKAYKDRLIGIVKNPNASPQLLRRINNEFNGEPTTKNSQLNDMISNPNLPVDLINTAYENRNNIDSETGESKANFSIGQSLSLNPNLSQSMMRNLFKEYVSLSQKEDSWRATEAANSILRNPSITEDLVDRVFKVGNSAWLSTLVHNPRAKEWTDKFKKLDHQKHGDTIGIGIYNGIFSDEDMGEMADKKKLAPGLISNILAQSKDPEVQRKVLQREDLDKRVLQEALHWYDNSMTKDTLEHLSQHEDKDVSGYAKLKMRTHADTFSMPEKKEYSEEFAFIPPAAPTAVQSKDETPPPVPQKEESEQVPPPIPQQATQETPPPIPQQDSQETIKISMDSPTLEDDLNKVVKILQEKRLEKHYKDLYSKVNKISKIIKGK